MIRRHARLALYLLLLSGAVGCVSADADTSRDARPTPTASLTAIIVDRSTSRTPAEIEQDRQLVQSIIDTLDFGDRILIQEVHHAGRADDAPRWWTDMPASSKSAGATPVDSQSLRRARQAAALAAKEILENGRPNRTDLMSNLFDVADLVRPGQFQRWRIILLSDMLQSTTDIDMEKRGGIPSSDWIAERQQRGLLPRLNGGCIVVVGADRSKPPGDSVFTFWQEYFRASGTDLLAANYRYTVFSGKELEC
jgi:hypothetical protein